MPKWRKLPACVLILLFLAWITGPSLAVEIGPDGKPLGKLGRDVDVRFLFPAGKNFSYESIFPLVVEYSNLSPQPQYFVLDWSLNFPVPESYKTVLVEPGTKKRLPFLLPPGTSSNLYSLRVNGQNVTIGLQNNNQSPVTGLMAPNNDSLDYLRGLQLEKNRYYNPANNNESEEYQTLQAVSTINHEVFPSHWAALESLDTLVCYDLNSLNLGTEQFKAIKRWVIRGGTLVLISNGLPNEYKNSPLHDLLPLTPKKATTENEIVLVEGASKPGATVVRKWGDQDKPLLTMIPVQRGKVYFLAAPVLDPGPLGKDLTTGLWRSVFDNVVANQPQAAIGYNVLDSMPELPRTHAGWIALFVVLYGITVGPINLTILRKKDKMLWAFVTVPVVAFFFAGGAYAVNRIMRPSQPVIREIGLLQISASSKIGNAESEQIIFSPAGRWFTVSSSSTTVFDSSNRNRYRSSAHDFGLYETTPEGGLKSHMEMGTWDIQRLKARSVLEVETAFEADWDEKKKIVTITSPIASDGKHAVISHPSLSCSDAFELKKGTHQYTLNFGQSSSPGASMDFDDEKNPGRYDLASQVWNNSNLSPMALQLYVFTKDLKTPLQLKEKAVYRHDYLATVELPK